MRYSEPKDPESDPDPKLFFKKLPPEPYNEFGTATLPLIGELIR